MNIALAIKHRFTGAVLFAFEASDEQQESGLALRHALESQQLRNQSRNRLLTFDGKTMCVTEWAEVAGINKPAINGRLRAGWPIERILTTPVRRCGQYRSAR